jgi:uncharacterized protein (DUF302 family)
MKYYFSKTITGTFDNAVKLATDALQAKGFGVITEIRMHEKLKEKLNVDFKKYTILGACNPAYAYKALQLEEKIGTMLPCNVLIIEQGKDKIEIAAVDPVASMQAITNTDLADIANEVSQALKSLVEHI